MNKPKHPLSPEDIFARALQENNNELSAAEMKLLTSGLTALRTHHKKHVTKTELQSIKALVAYVAFTQTVNESNVRTIVTAYFDAKTIETLPSYRYQEIIEYLIDLEVNKVIN